MSAAADEEQDPEWSPERKQVSRSPRKAKHTAGKTAHNAISTMQHSPVNYCNGCQPGNLASSNFHKVTVQITHSEISHQMASDNTPSAELLYSPTALLYRTQESAPGDAVLAASHGCCRVHICTFVCIRHSQVKSTVR